MVKTRLRLLLPAKVMEKSLISLENTSQNLGSFRLSRRTISRFSSRYRKNIQAVEVMAL